MVKLADLKKVFGNDFTVEQDAEQTFTQEQLDEAVKAARLEAAEKAKAEATKPKTYTKAELDEAVKRAAEQGATEATTETKETVTETTEATTETTESTTTATKAVAPTNEAGKTTGTNNNQPVGLREKMDKGTATGKEVEEAIKDGSLANLFKEYASQA